MSITWPFFKLQTPGFAWKFVWTDHRDPCKFFFSDLGKTITRPFLGYRLQILHGSKSRLPAGIPQKKIFRDSLKIFKLGKNKEMAITC